MPKSLVAGGLQANQNVQTMVEVWASEKTGTFTMLLTSPEGVSCVVAIGTDFFTRPTTDAIEGLARSILMFTDDGRSMPIMLDEVEKICQSDEKLSAQLLTFYKKFLPRIPTKRGKRPSKHCIKMYKRGIAVFNKFGDSAAASFYQKKVDELESAQ